MSERRAGSWERAKESKGLSLGLALVGSLGSPIGLLAWIGVTPETVGQSAYDALFVAWPLIVAGLAFLAGWNIRKLLATRGLGERDARIRELEETATDAAGRIIKLQNQVRDRDSALESTTRKNEAIERELDDLRKTARAIIREKSRASHRMVEAEAERDKLRARLAEYEDEKAAVSAVLDAADGPVAALLSRLYEMGAAIAPDDPWSPGIDEARPYLVARGLVLEVGGKLVLAPIAEKRIRETPGMADRLSRAAEECIESYREGEAMLAEMSADIEYRRRCDADCAALASEPYWQKVMLACLRDKGKVILFSDGDVDTDQLEAFVEGRSEAMGRFVRLTTVGAAGTRAELSEEGEDALHDHPELLQGVDWETFSPIDREFAYDPGSSPLTVTCQGMQWLVNVDL